jgi:fluoroacetyl-CoA thioesterase
MPKKKSTKLKRGLQKTTIRPVEFRRTIALATPSMIGQMEVAAAELLQPYLPKGSMSVGTHIDVSHRAAATVGERLRVTASFDHAYHPRNSGRLRYVFAVEARVGKRLIGDGTVERAVVQPAFANRLQSKRPRKKR